MSLDPAVTVSKDLSNALPFSELSITHDGVYIFDFDGVISSRFEDDIYKLEPNEEEQELITIAAQRFGIRCDGMEQRYQRHLVYQAAAWKLNIEIEPGTALNLAKIASEKSRLFILTARSSWYAVERLRNFLKRHLIVPIEIYNVGRVKKDQQVGLICKEYQDRSVVFIDDSSSHLEHVAQLAENNLQLVLLKNTAHVQPDTRRLAEHFQHIVKEAIKLWSN
jgi:GAF domain-containing protein